MLWNKPCSIDKSHILPQCCMVNVRWRNILFHYFFLVHKSNYCRYDCTCNYDTGNWCMWVDIIYVGKLKECIHFSRWFIIPSPHPTPRELNKVSLAPCSSRFCRYHQRVSSFSSIYFYPLLYIYSCMSWHRIVVANA